VPIDSKKQRTFAVEVVARLRAAGHTAYWAGGCVRDELLGRPPVDFDVATDASPDEVREIFGRRRTRAVGAAFGVIQVLGPRGAGQVEVATFRSDLSYSDGRHPDAVRFATPQEDALRRDFTINGLFYDPMSRQVIDYVNGLQDLRAGIIRAIGDPRVRFAEDYLRMVRAVRFVAQLRFQLEEGTLAAVRVLAERIESVSRERIAAELEKLLTAEGRGEAAQLLHESGLLQHIVPPIALLAQTDSAQWEKNLAVLARLQKPNLASALAAVADRAMTPDEGRHVARRLRLSNVQGEELAWLLQHRDTLDHAAEQPWSCIQPALISPWADDLLDWAEARAAVERRDQSHLKWCRAKRRLPPHELNPAPFLRGDDLLRYKLPTGPIYRRLLEEAWQEQLDGNLDSRETALAWLERRVAEEMMRITAERNGAEPIPAGPGEETARSGHRSHELIPRKASQSGRRKAGRSDASETNAAGPSPLSSNEQAPRHPLID